MRLAARLVLGAGTGALTGAALFTLALPPLPEFFLLEQLLIAQLGAGLIACALALVLWGVMRAGRLQRVADAEPRQQLAFGLILGVLSAAVPFWSTSYYTLVSEPADLMWWAFVPSILLGLLAPQYAERLSRYPLGQNLVMGAGIVATVCAAAFGPARHWAGHRDYPPIPDMLPAIAETMGEQPDVVLVSIDTLRADAIVGENSAKVPHLDELRSRGTWAPYARSSSNCTVPGHTGMLTGLHALEHRVTVNFQELPEGPQTVAESFRDGGWSTVALVSNGILIRGTGFERGFQHYDDALISGKSERYLVLQHAQRNSLASALLPRRYFRMYAERLLFAMPATHAVLPPKDAEGGQTTERALRWLDMLYSQEDPFFFFLHYMDPHAPYAAPEGFRGRRSTPADKHKSAPRYLEEVEFIDACLKRVTDRLDSSGRPYILLLTSDHGEHLGDHDLFGHTNSGFEQLIRVPFFLYGPGVAQQQIQSPHLADIAPTLLQLVGLPADPDMSGIDLLSSPADSHGRLHFARERRTISVTEGDWKWVVYNREGLPTSDVLATAGEAYNLATDPDELMPLPLSALPAGWHQKVLDLYVKAPDPLPALQAVRVRAEKMAALEQLGYLDQGR